jgi:hypothetical protein
MIMIATSSMMRMTIGAVQFDMFRKIIASTKTRATKTR